MIKIIPESNKNNAVPALGHSVIFALVKLGVDPIAGRFQVSKNRDKGLAAIGAHQPSHVFCHENHGLVMLKHLDSRLIKRPEAAFQSLLLPDQAEVVAGKTEGEGINGGKLVQLDLGDIAADDAGFGRTRNVVEVGLAGRWI